MTKEVGIFGLLALLCVITVLLNPQFITGVNISNLANLIGMSGEFIMPTELTATHD